MHPAQAIEKLGDAGFHNPDYRVSLNLNKGTVEVDCLRSGKSTSLFLSVVESETPQTLYKKVARGLGV